MAKRNSPPTPSLQVQPANPRQGANIFPPPPPLPLELSSPSDDIGENQSLLSSEEVAVKSDLATRFLYSDYYSKGINLIKPEILASLEFTPIVKEENEAQGLQMTTLDGEQASVKQVLRLIELHSAIQLAANEATKVFINDFSGFDVKQLYNFLMNDVSGQVDNIINTAHNSGADSQLDQVVNAIINEVTPEIRSIMVGSAIQEYIDEVTQTLNDMFDGIY